MAGAKSGSTAETSASGRRELRPDTSGKHAISIFRLKMTTNVRRAIAAHSAGVAPPTGALQVAYGRVRLPGWSCKREVIFGRNPLLILPSSALPISGLQTLQHITKWATRATIVPVHQFAIPRETDGFAPESPTRQSMAHGIKVTQFRRHALCPPIHR